MALEEHLQPTGRLGTRSPGRVLEGQTLNTLVWIWAYSETIPQLQLRHRYL